MDVDGCDEPGIQPWTALLVEALIGVGRRDEAEELIRSVELKAHERSHPTELLRVFRLRGLLLASGKRLMEAAAVLEDGRRCDPTGRAPFERALLKAAYGAVLHQLGEGPEALAALDEASRLFTTLGAQPYLDRCRRLQVSAGREPTPPGVSGIERLTPHEQAVATLVASGLSNRETAERLIVSVKTVEYHLGHVFTKLGVNSRGRMAVKLHSLGWSSPF
ncbi:MAG: LuxR C-terminal-related transcriptional regulator, partial [Acidimicrobiales bacterium]